VTQVVGGHLALEALRGEQERSAHDAGVAGQGGEVVVAVEQRLGAARDLVDVGQVLDPLKGANIRVALRRRFACTRG
jgi:hypothetical protein